MSAAERRRSPGQIVCLEGILSDNPGQHRALLDLEQRFWRQISRRSFYDAADTMDQIIGISEQGTGSMERIHASVFSSMELVLNLTSEGQGDSTDFPFQSLLGDLGRAKTFGDMRTAVYDILACVEDRLCSSVGGRNRKMPGIEQYIRENYADQNLGANTIADAFKISPSYLSRIFRNDLGMGLVEYIHRVRVDAARELLTGTSLNMEEVALRSGFTNRSALFRVFKQLEGITPGAYRVGATGADTKDRISP